MLRRNLRELVENAAEGKIEREVQVPAVSLNFCLLGDVGMADSGIHGQTIEDMSAIEVARKRIKEYFAKQRSTSKAKL